MEAHSMLELDGARHARLRRLVVGAFTSARVSGMSLAISSLTDKLISEFPAGPSNFQSPFRSGLRDRSSSRLSCARTTLAHNSVLEANDIFAMYQARRTRAIEEAGATPGAYGEFRAYLKDALAQKKKAPGNNLNVSSDRGREQGDRLNSRKTRRTAVLPPTAGSQRRFTHLATALTNAPQDRTALQALRPQAREPATVRGKTRFDPPLHMCYPARRHDDLKIPRFRLPKARRWRFLPREPDPRSGRLKTLRPHSPPCVSSPSVECRISAIARPLARHELQIALTGPHIRQRLPPHRRAAAHIQISTIFTT